MWTEDVDVPQVPATVSHDAGGDSNSIRQYLQEIGRVPLLKPAEERALCAQIEAAQHGLAAALLVDRDTRRHLHAALRAARKDEAAAATLLEWPDGRSVVAADVERALAAFAGAQRGIVAMQRLDAAIPNHAGRERVRLDRRAEHLFERLVQKAEVIRFRPATLEELAEGVTGAGPSRERIVERLSDVRRLKQRLMEANLRLVVSIAKRYQHSTLSFLDLVQEGNLGLMRAVDKFQYRRGFRFSTYATWWIRQAVTRGISDTGRTIRLPAHVSDVLSRTATARRRLITALGREPTLIELADQTRIPADKITQAIRSDTMTTSLDSTFADDASALSEFLSDAATPSPDAELIRRDATFHARRSLSSLSEREREVIELRFGLRDARGRTLQQIADRLGVSRERVRQIEERALARLRRAHSPPEINGAAA